MATAASIAQFMAILSGGGNNSAIATLRGQKGIAGTLAPQTQNTKIDFDALLKIATPEQRQMILQSSLLNNPEQSINPGFILFNHIQNQGQQISADVVKTELSKNNIPEDIIQKLQGMFTTSELTALVTNPKLKAQFESVIADANVKITDAKTSTQINASTTLASEQTEEMLDVIALVITGILQQNKGRLENTISFSPSLTTVTDKGIKNLIEISEATAQADFAQAQLIPVEQKIQPLQLAIMQSQYNGQEAPVQTITPVASGANPFTPLKEAKSATPQVNNDGETTPVLQNMMPTKGSEQPQNQTVQSIADRLGAITQNSNGQSGGFDLSVQLSISADGESLLVDGEYLMPFSAGFKTAAQAANPLLSHVNATQSNPATQLVALSLNKMAVRGVDGDISQNFKIRLDPPELGKVDIEMDFMKESQKIKAVITVDKPETLGLLQRDMNHLLKSMHDAGFTDMTQRDLSFNLSSGNDGQSQDGQNNNNSNASGRLSASNDNGTDIPDLDMQMSVIIDPITGQQSVNMLV